MVYKIVLVIDVLILSLNGCSLSSQRKNTVKRRTGLFRPLPCTSGIDVKHNQGLIVLFRPNKNYRCNINFIYQNILSKHNIGKDKPPSDVYNSTCFEPGYIHSFRIQEGNSGRCIQYGLNSNKSHSQDRHFYHLISSFILL